MGHSNRFGSRGQHRDKLLTDTDNFIKRIFGHHMLTGIRIPIHTFIDLKSDKSSPELSL